MTKRWRWSHAIAMARRSRLKTIAAAAIATLILATVVLAAAVTVRTVIHKAHSMPPAQAGPVAPGGGFSPNGGGPLLPRTGSSGTASGALESSEAGVLVTPTRMPAFTFPPILSLPPTAPPGNVTITAQSSGTVAVSRGETIYVVLSVPGRYWSAPQASDSAVLDLLSATTSRTGVASGTFRAGAPGDATLSSTGSVCPTGTCVGSRWQVTVQVLG